ncbi:MAG: hypothetical protein UHD09_03735 [Bifidobacterium sp.]|nr:hypothetical protein [Bifidobacterium sp.]
MALVVAMLAASVACGAQGQSSATDTADLAAVKVASSLTERIEYLLKVDGSAATPMSERQRVILRRALERDGVVSRADYDQAWSNYQQCMIDYGYTRPVVPTYADGLRSPLLYPKDEGHSAEEMAQLASHDQQCRAREYLIVDECYRDHLANPNLYAEPTVAVVDCLRREELVPASYTGKRFLEEEQVYHEVHARNMATDPTDASGEAAAQFSFDLHAPKAVTCLVANGKDVGQAEDFEGWDAFG